MKEKFGILMLAIPFAILTMVSAGFANAANNTSQETQEPYPYISPTPGEFPIIGWGIEADSTYSIYKDFMDCGFNAAIAVDSHDKTRKLITALNPVNGKDTIKLSLIAALGWFANNREPEEMPGAMDYVSNLFEERRSPGNKTPVTGWIMCDEPKYYQFDRLAKHFHSAAQHDTTRMLYTNLIGDQKANSFLYYLPGYSIGFDPNPDPGIFPMTKSNSQNRSLPTVKRYVSLRKYVEDFCEKFRPGVLSYDYYPFVVDINRKDITIEKDRLHDFYAALQLYSDISKKRNRPFWAFCQCRATCVDSAYNNKEGHPAPTENFLRYEAFNALAFGAQGIQYWDYKERNVPTEKPDTNAYALVTKDGHKTSAWYAARKVNHEIKSLSKVFLGAKLESYYFVGDLQDTTYSDYKKGSSYPIMVTTRKPLIDSIGSNSGALVSTLKNGNNHYVVIVNQSPYKHALLQLTLDEQRYFIKELTAPNIQNMPDSTSDPAAKSINILPPGSYKYKNVTLPPAQYKIYTYRRRSTTQL